MNKPEVYLDMDGVIADFFAEYAKLAGVENGNYRDIPPAKVDPTLDKMIGTDFFARLPKFSTADALVSIIVKTFGGYHICSSPLRGDHANSEKQKRIWIQHNLKQAPTNIIITPNKAKYAVQADGTPNILIDDRGSNISAWEAKGGVGIKYQADEDTLDTVMSGFRRALDIIKGQQKHEPQKLQSLDRGKMIAVQQSGDSDEEPKNESLKTDNPCWKGYKPVGTKKKNGRTVPNCVPKGNKK
jgi:5'(3')-deoxyribonucleotidase